MIGSIISDNARSRTTSIISAIILCVTCVLCFFLVMLTIVLLAQATCGLMELVTTEPVSFCARLDGTPVIPVMLGYLSSFIVACIFLSSFIKQSTQRGIIWQLRWVAFLILLFTIVLSAARLAVYCFASDVNGT